MRAMDDGVEMGVEAPARSGRRDWRAGDVAQVGVVTFSHAVQHFYVAALALSYPFVVADFHISYGTLGVLLGVAGLIGGLLQASAGLVRRVSARLLLAGQNLGLAVALLLAAVAPSFALFSVARMVGAFSSWPQHPVGSAHLAERFPKRRGMALSWHTTGGSIGTLVVPLTAGALIARFDWRWALVVFAVAMVIGGVLVLVGLRDTRSRAAGPSSAGASDGGSPGSPARDAEPVADGATGGGGDTGTPAYVPLRAVMRRRTVIAVLLASTIAAAGRGLGALTTYVPAYLRSDLHFGALQVGLVFTVLVVGSILGPLFVGQLSDRLGRRPVLVTVYVVGAAALLAFVLVGAQIAALTVVGLLVGVFAYAESPLLQSLFSDAIQGANSRAAFGMYFALAYGIGSLWLTGLGAIITAAGFHEAFIAMAASFLVAAAIITVVRPSRAR